MGTAAPARGAAKWREKPLEIPEFDDRISIGGGGVCDRVVGHPRGAPERGVVAIQRSKPAFGVGLRVPGRVPIIAVPNEPAGVIRHAKGCGVD
jgi:hypothetical protein